MGKAYLIFPDENKRPTVVNNIKVYSEITYATEITTAKTGDTVYVELTGTDAEPGRANIALVNVTSDSSPLGFRLSLYETGKNTGKYRNSFTISGRTHDDYQWIKGLGGDTVRVTSVLNNTKEVTISITNPIKIFPEEDKTEAVEDEEYISYYWQYGWDGADWNLDTDADWLEWDGMNERLIGTPDNNDVGVHHVKLTLQQGADKAVREFDVTVRNAPPNITTNATTQVYEDALYAVDYDSDDDGQGNVTWHLEGNATWLEINEIYGLLNGTPLNEHVGWYDVHVGVNDGNGGWDWSNFTLTVNNTNDAPEILTDDDLTATEEQGYSVQYEAVDVDIGDTFEWEFTSNASWLSMDTAGLLSGTPADGDAGWYRVNVTAKDSFDAMGTHLFNITVYEKNEAPFWADVPGNGTISVGDTWTFDSNASDPNVGDVLIYNISADPDTNIAINSSTGVITWAPDDNGDFEITMTVSDGLLEASHVFNMHANALPIVTLISPSNGSVVYTLQTDLVWSGTDAEGADLMYHFYLDTDIDKVRSLDPSALRGSLNGTSRESLLDERGETYYWTVIPDDGITRGICESGIWSYTIALNNAPLMTPVEPQTATVGKEFRLQLYWNDTDPWDATNISFSLGEGPAGVVIGSDGMLSWKPTANQTGEHEIVVYLTDGKDHVKGFINVTVEDRASSGNGTDDLLMPILVVVIIVIVVVVAVAVVLMRKKGRPEPVLQEGAQQSPVR